MNHPSDQLKTEFEWRKTPSGTGWRCYQVGTDIEFGTLFQAAVRSPEWCAASTVYEKYKRKMNLEHADLKSLADYAVEQARAYASKKGKPINYDHLVQVCSAQLRKA